MRTNLLDSLKTLLQKDERLVSKDELWQNKIVELAVKQDKDLLELLLEDQQLREVFFMQVGEATIFDKDKFIRFVSNKQFLPDSYTAFGNKIGLTADDEIISRKKDVVLSWPYKDCILEGGMTKEDQKRDEIFWNQTLAWDEISRLLDPKVFTNAKRIDKNGEHKFDRFKTDKKGDIKDNLIIKGNNLLALHSLKKRFAGKVKLIYIDPPYNREDKNFYNDSFKHSTWLVFMKNRLEVAKELLKADEGVIFVQCDDREHAYLKVLMDEIFGRENFISSIAVKVKAPSGVATGGLIFDVKENILVYGRKKDIKPINNLIEKEVVNEKSKTIESYNMLFESEGTEGEKISELMTQNGKIEIKRMKNYIIKKLDFKKIKNVGEFYVKNFEKIFRTATLSGGIEEKIKKLIPDNGLFSYYHTPSKGKYKGQRVKYYVYKKEGILFLKENAILKQKGRKKNVVKLEQLTNIISEDLWQGIANEGSVKLKFGKKPEELLRIVLDLVTKKGDLVLDFFMGTGSTCAVAHKMNRQYIGVEQLDYGKNSAVVRLKNVINGDQTGVSKSVGWKGGGDFVYLELMKWNENFVEEIQKAKTKEELKHLWETMKEKAFLSYKVDIKVVDEKAKDFQDLSIEDQKRFLYECLDKNHFYVNYSEIDDEEYGVTEEDKKLNRRFYGN